MKKKQRRRARHTFHFKIETGDGSPAQIITSKATVTPARKAVDLVLTADDVRKSIKARGIGNTQTCSMSMCVKRSARAFPHRVAGYVDWQYSRAYVVTKVSNGMPVACVSYRHSDNVAKLNDTKGGQQKLLEFLEAKGACVIRLLPIGKRKASVAGKPRGRSDGTRSARPAAVGAKLRFAVANPGITL